MASTVAAVLAIKVISDATNAIKGMDTMGGKMGKFQSGLAKMAGPAAIAGAAVIKFGSDAVQAASKTEQAMGGVDAVFGKSAGQVKKWSDQAASSVGLSKSQYGEMATTLGSQLKNMGIPMDQVAGKTNDLIKKGADLSAMFGGTSAEAVAALGSALRGETDPIEKYGVSIKQADIAAQQAKDGTDKLTGAAGKQAKTMALLKLVNDQTATSVGKFASESDTAAGSAQITAAKMENMKASMGKALLPVVSMLTAKLGSLATWMQNNQKLVQILVVAVGAFAASIFILIGALKVYEAVSKAVAIVSKATWLSNPIFLVIAAVVLLVAGMVLLYKKSSAFRNFVDGMWAGIKSAAKATAQVFKAVWSAAFAVVKSYVKIWLAIFKGALDVVKGAIKLVVAIFKGDWRGAFDAVKQMVRAVKDTFLGIFRALPGPVKDVAARIWSAMQGAFSKITTAVGKLGEILSKPFETAKGAVDGLVDVIGDLISWLGRIKIPDALSKVGGLVGKIPGFKAAPPPASFSASVQGRGFSPDPSLGGAPRAAAAGGGGGATIVVNGALDPEAVARQIARILDGHSRRVGLVSA